MVFRPLLDIEALIINFYVCRFDSEFYYPPGLPPLEWVFLIREKSHYTILPLESRNQESAQIPGFWIPMVKWCNGIFL